MGVRSDELGVRSYASAAPSGTLFPAYRLYILRILNNRFCLTLLSLQKAAILPRFLNSVLIYY